MNTQLRKTKGLSFWTISYWEDKDAMMVFFSSGAHRDAMPQLKHWCDEASLTHWTEDALKPVDWDFAEQQLNKHGRLSKVLHPSSEHKERYQHQQQKR